MTKRLLSSVAFAALFAAAAHAQAPAPSAPAPLVVKSVRFTSTPSPTSEALMVTPHTSSSMIVTLADGSEKTFPLDYRILHRSGEYVGGGYAGLITDKDGKPLMHSAPNKSGDVAMGPFKSAAPDGTSLLKIAGPKADGQLAHARQSSRI